LLERKIDATLWLLLEIPGGGQDARATWRGLSQAGLT